MADHTFEQPAARARLPPRWFVRGAWLAHRGLYQLSGGRLGLYRPTPTGWGTLRLTTVGRRTGKPRVAILGYVEDGPNLVTLAMNGWADPEPAWWLNLQTARDTVVVLADGPRAVHAQAATGAERARLWARWRAVGTRVHAYARRRSRETTVVVLEPRGQATPSQPRPSGS
jgi:deazaflavin-dependent oxidoreductase (nitroreductase family)